MFSIIELTKTVASALNSKANHSDFIKDVLNFECLV